MSSKTTNLELNINYRSPSTHLDLKNGYDENYNILDEQYQYILGTLENTDVSFSESIDLVDPVEYTWELVTMKNLQSIVSSDVWSCGNTLYYSPQGGTNNQWSFESSTLTWKSLGNSASYWGFYLFGNRVWKTKNNIYYSCVSYPGPKSNQKKWNSDIAEWEDITWNGDNLLDFGFWNTINNTYYNNGQQSYKVDETTMTMINKNWSIAIRSGCVWSDGITIYHTYNGITHKLTDEENGYWIQVNWNNPDIVNGSYIWNDINNNVYYSYEDKQYVLNKKENTWEIKDWGENVPQNGSLIWQDLDNNIYYTGYDSISYKLTVK